jgi:dihydropteroate synthase
MGKYSGKIRPKIIKTQDFCLLLSYRMKKTMKTPLYINVNGRLMDLSEPQVMGILNVTPDSFYAGSRSETEKDIVQRLHQIIDEGASIIDIGGYSSRPNAEHISAEEEMSRLRNGLEIIRKHSPNAVVSVDTFRADVAKMCVEEYGVAIINDISAGQMDEQMFPTIAKLGVPYIIMHMKGTPQNMQMSPQYDHFLKEIFYYFSEKVQKLRDLGVKDIIIDPGFGFGKTLEHNYELMNHLEEFSLFELPLLVGVSRKSMIYKLLETTPEEALNGTTALHTIALLKGANILRVHDVKEAVESIKIVQKMKACQAF